MVTSILHPKLIGEHFEENLLQWDRRITEYEASTKVPLPSGVKCALLMQNSPPKVREWMKSLSGNVLDDYEADTAGVLVAVEDLWQFG
jgi:hypothetical protein